MTTRLEWCSDQLPFCCGMYEVGNFEINPRGWGWQQFDDLAGQKLDEALVAMKQEAEGRPIIFNFVKPRLSSGKWASRYEAWQLRELVLADPACLDIGTHINPGSKNRIHTLILKGYKVK